MLIKSKPNKVTAQFNMEAQIGAKFKFLKSKVNSKGDEEITLETDWVDNIVTDWGLNQLGSSTGNQFLYLLVGSSSVTPDASQTTLQNKIAGSSTNSPTTPSNVIQTTTAPFYVAVKKSYRFNAGVATGTIAEVGLSPNNVNVFNRALVKDSNGNPTTITVLADEILDVLCEVRIYLPQTISGSFPLKDKLGNTIRTVNYTGKPYLVSNPASLQTTLSKVEAIAIYGALTAYTGTLNSGYTTQPNGTYAVSSGSDITYSNSYPTNLQNIHICKYGATVGNMSHKSITLKYTGLFAASTPNIGYQLEFDEAIVKTSSETLQYSFSLSWGRYVA